MPSASRTASEASAKTAYRPGDYVLAQRGNNYPTWPAVIVESTGLSKHVKEQRRCPRSKELCVRLLAADDEHVWALPETLEKLTKNDVDAFVDDESRAAEPVYTAYKAVLDALNWIEPALAPPAGSCGHRVLDDSQWTQTQESQTDQLASDPDPLSASAPSAAKPKEKLRLKSKPKSTAVRHVIKSAALIEDSDVEMLDGPSAPASPAAGLHDPDGDEEHAEEAAVTPIAPVAPAGDTLGDDAADVSVPGLVPDDGSDDDDEVIGEAGLPPFDADPELEDEEQTMVWSSSVGKPVPSLHDTGAGGDRRQGTETLAPDDGEEQGAYVLSLDAAALWRDRLYVLLCSDNVELEHLSQADDIFSCLETLRLPDDVILSSCIHDLMKRLWLDDTLLGILLDGAVTYHLRARAMKLYLAWSARGLVSTRVTVAVPDEAPEVESGLSLSHVDERRKLQTPYDQHLPGRRGICEKGFEDEADMPMNKSPKRKRFIDLSTDETQEISRSASPSAETTRRAKRVSLGALDADKAQSRAPSGPMPRQLDHEEIVSETEDEDSVLPTPPRTIKRADSSVSMFEANRDAAAASAESNPAGDADGNNGGSDTDSDSSFDSTMSDAGSVRNLNGAMTDSPFEEATVAEPTKNDVAEPAPKLPAAPSPAAPHDDNFYDQALIVQAGDRLFSVLRHVFAGSPLFEGMFALPPPPGPVDGDGDAQPLVLHGVSAEAFRAFLRAMMAGRMRPHAPALVTREWISVLHLADLWGMASLKADAIAAIEASFTVYQTDTDTSEAADNVPPLERIRLAIKYDIPHWELDVLAELVWRKAAPGPAELHALGIHRFFKLLPARERRLRWRMLRNRQPVIVRWMEVVENTVETFSLRVEDTQMHKIIDKREDCYSDDEDLDD